MHQNKDLQLLSQTVILYAKISIANDGAPCQIHLLGKQINCGSKLTSKPDFFMQVPPCVPASDQNAAIWHSEAVWRAGRQSYKHWLTCRVVDQVLAGHLSLLAYLTVSCKELEEMEDRW